MECCFLGTQYGVDEPLLLLMLLETVWKIGKIYNRNEKLNTLIILGDVNGVVKYKLFK